MFVVIEILIAGVSIGGMVIPVYETEHVVYVCDYMFKIFGNKSTIQVNRMVDGETIQGGVTLSSLNSFSSGHMSMPECPLTTWVAYKVQ